MEVDLTPANVPEPEPMRATTGDGDVLGTVTRMRDGTYRAIPEEGGPVARVDTESEAVAHLLNEAGRPGEFTYHRRG